MSAAHRADRAARRRPARRAHAGARDRRTAPRAGSGGRRGPALRRVFGGRLSTGGPRPTGLSGLRHGSTAAPSAQNGGVGAVRAGRRAGRALQGVGVRRRDGGRRVARAAWGCAAGRTAPLAGWLCCAPFRGASNAPLTPCGRPNTAAASASTSGRSSGRGASRGGSGVRVPAPSCVTGSAVCSVMCGRRSWAACGRMCASACLRRGEVGVEAVGSADPRRAGQLQVRVDATAARRCSPTWACRPR